MARITRTQKTRALVAGGAGIAILFASGSTFALWHAQERLGADDVNTGSFSIEVGEFNWYDRSPRIGDGTGALVDNDYLPKGRQIPNLEDFHLVPGDLLVGTVDVNVANQLGTNLAVSWNVVNGVNVEDIPGLHLGGEVEDGIVTITLDWRGGEGFIGTEGMGQRLDFSNKAHIELIQQR